MALILLVRQVQLLPTPAMRVAQLLINPSWGAGKMVQYSLRIKLSGEIIDLFSEKGRSFGQHKKYLSCFKLDGHNTSVTVRRKKPGAKVPDTKFIHHVAGRIIIGKKGKLGIPIQINITGSENLQSRRDEFKLEGKAFATIGDLKMKDQNVDLSYDSMDTLRFVGKQYLANKHHVDEVNIEREFKLSRKYIRNIPYPQSGFLSIRYLVDTDSHVAKLQLYKDKNSWEVVRELKPTQIAPAHPIKEINESDLREVLHQKVAPTLETALKEENLMSLVRSVNLAKYDCKIDKNKTIGLCKATIKVEQEDDVLCQKRNYLAEYHERDAWMVNKTVSNDLKLDYQTGKLVKKDKRTGTEKIAMKVFNFVFNECN